MGLLLGRKRLKAKYFWEEKKMKSALDYNPDSIIIRNFWEEKK